MIEAKVIEDSISESGVRLTTIQARYHRFIHAEAKTHRVIANTGEEYEQLILTQDESVMSYPMFSRNASSSRAIPIAKMIEQVRNDPAIPVHFGKNQPGMQAREELVGLERAKVHAEWLLAAHDACTRATTMMELGAAKQIVNRLLEPFQWISVVITATEWDNFFELRDHEDAQPEIQVLARAIKKARGESKPTVRCFADKQNERGWHLPYITAEERVQFSDYPQLLTKCSTARCARVSYLTHEGKQPDIQKDMDLYDRLVGSEPLHASPTEHIGHPLEKLGWCKNFRGWFQFRASVEAMVKQQEYL